MRLPKSRSHNDTPSHTSPITHPAPRIVGIDFDFEVQRVITADGEEKRFLCIGDDTQAKPIAWIDDEMHFWGVQNVNETPRASHPLFFVYQEVEGYLGCFYRIDADFPAREVARVYLNDDTDEMELVLGDIDFDEDTLRSRTHSLLTLCCAFYIKYVYLTEHEHHELLSAVLGDEDVHAFPEKHALAGAIHELLHDMFNMPLGDALDMCMYRLEAVADKDHPAEKYMYELFQTLDMASLRDISTREHITIGLLSSNKLAWLRFNPVNLSAHELGLLFACESLLNRLILLQRPDVALAAKTIFDSSDADPKRFALFDALTFFIVTAQQNFAPDSFGSCPISPFDEVETTPGGQWDIRARFAYFVEKLALPYRLSYSFDYDDATGLFEIHYSVPPLRYFKTYTSDALEALTANMPAHIAHLSDYFPREAEADIDNIARGLQAMTSDETLCANYTLRIGGLMAGMAFACGMNVRNVLVHAHEMTMLGPCVFSGEFERTIFKAHTRHAIFDMSSFILPLQGADDLEELQTMRAQIAADSEGALKPIEPLSSPIMREFKNTWENEEYLPEDLRADLQADRISELDINHDSDPELSERIMRVARMAEDNPHAALQELESLLVLVEASEAMEEATSEPNRKPLYCTTYGARMIMPLIYADEHTRYRLVSTSYFLARNLHTRLLREQGRYEESLEVARACITIAPTSMDGYFNIISTLLEMGKPEPALRYIDEALRVCSVPSDAEYLLYRRAFVYWQINKLELARACYTILIEMNGQFKDRAIDERDELTAQMSTTDELTLADAFDTLAREKVSFQVSAEVKRRITSMAVRLTEAGLFLEAAPLSGYLEFYYKSDACAVVGQSLLH